MRVIIFSIAAILSGQGLYAQNSDSSAFTWSGYMEAYYAYDFNQPKNGNRPPFTYSFNRHNELNVNLGFLKASYTSSNIRGNMAIMTGTYANANLAAEPGVLRNILEANAGVKISSSKNLWVDAGIFASHIGFESAIGRDSWNLTRSILADNTPYFESGLKLSYTSDDNKWFVSGLVLNGWQRIQRVSGNSLLSFGTQVTFKPNEKTLLNSSTFIGTDTPDSARLMRYFHNFYGIFQVSPRLGLTLGFDYGIQQSAAEAGAYDPWWAPIAIARITMSDKVSVDVRAEYYVDNNGVIIATRTPNGFETLGLSVNLDYKISSQALWRIEVRNFSSKDPIFQRDNDAVTHNTFCTTALAISF